MSKLACAILFALLSSLFAAIPASAQTNLRCFSETGYCIKGRIREFWEQNGGLAIFGFPIGEQHEDYIEGEPFQVQWFERNRLELHPENQRPYDVLLGRLGAEAFTCDEAKWLCVPADQRPGYVYFAATWHNVEPAIAAVWFNNCLDLDGRSGCRMEESLALFGYPTTEPFADEWITPDGAIQVRTVQYFERARFEIHPELGGKVLLGLLGKEALN